MLISTETMRKVIKDYIDQNFDSQCFGGKAYKLKNVLFYISKGQMEDKPGFYVKFVNLAASWYFVHQNLNTWRDRFQKVIKKVNKETGFKYPKRKKMSVKDMDNILTEVKLIDQKIDYQYKRHLNNQKLIKIQEDF